MYKQHILNYHSNKEEREEGFKYYCKLCDYGSFSKDFFNCKYLFLYFKYFL
jgi:hypothetical protein